MRNTDRKMWFFLGSGDIILINFAFVLAYFLKFDTIELKENYIFLLLVFNFSWILVSAMFSLYTFSRVDHFEHIVSNTIKAGVTHALIITAFATSSGNVTTWIAALYLGATFPVFAQKAVSMKPPGMDTKVGA